jgi:hypothetical protein
MSQIEDAQQILKALGLPPAQQNEMAALTLLALCGVGPGDSWQQAQRRDLTITKGIMAFVAAAYGRQYAPNTRETFRRQVLHQFVQAHIADYNPSAPELPTNSPRAHYALTEAALVVTRAFGTSEWEAAVRRFLQGQGSLSTLYQRNRASRLIPVHMPDGLTFELSPGRHNQLQATIIDLFAPRFVPGGRLLYLGDTAKKNLYMDSARLNILGVSLSEHDKLPDVILHDEDHNWLFLIEAVTSHGPVTAKRVIELETMFAHSAAGLVFVSVFPSMMEFRKYVGTVAWDTEVWLADMPDHLIHFNGDRFLGPRTRTAVTRVTTANNSV